MGFCASGTSRVSVCLHLSGIRNLRKRACKVSACPDHQTLQGCCSDAVLSPVSAAPGLPAFNKSLTGPQRVDSLTRIPSSGPRGGGGECGASEVYWPLDGPRWFSTASDGLAPLSAAPGLPALEQILRKLRSDRFVTPPNIVWNGLR